MPHDSYYTKLNKSVVQVPHSPTVLAPCEMCEVWCEGDGEGAAGTSGGVHVTTATAPPPPPPDGDERILLTACCRLGPRYP